MRTSPSPGRRLTSLRTRTKTYPDCATGRWLGILHLVFYIERHDHIDVWRVLHGQRDIPEWMRGHNE